MQIYIQTKGGSPQNKFCLTIPFSSLLRRKCNKLLGFFINHVFFGVFQYDLGPPKRTLELRNFVLINVSREALVEKAYKRAFFGYLPLYGSCNYIRNSYQ